MGLTIWAPWGKEVWWGTLAASAIGSGVGTIVNGGNFKSFAIGFGISIAAGGIADGIGGYFGGGAEAFAEWAKEGIGAYVAGALTGAVSGAISSAVYGGKTYKNMLQGAISGAIGTGVGMTARAITTELKAWVEGIRATQEFVDNPNETTPAEVTSQVGKPDSEKNIIFFYYDDTRVDAYRARLQALLQQSMNEITGTTDCVKVYVRYRPGFHKMELGRVAHKEGKYSIYRFGMRVYNKMNVAGRNDSRLFGILAGNWGKISWWHVEQASNPARALHRLYMHELFWHGPGGLNQWLEGSTDFSSTFQNSSVPLQFTPEEKRKLRHELFDME